jgi:hypothetical protein
MMKKLGILLVIISAISFCPLPAVSADLDDIHNDLQNIDDDMSFQWLMNESEKTNAQMKAMIEQGLSNRELELYKSYFKGNRSPEATAIFFNKAGHSWAESIKNALPEYKKKYKLPLGSGSDLYASELILNDIFLKNGWKTKEEHDSLLAILKVDFCFEANTGILLDELEYGAITEEKFNKQMEKITDDYKNKRGDYSNNANSVKWQGFSNYNQKTAKFE